MEQVAQGTELHIQNTGSPQSFMKITGLTSINPSRMNLLAEVTNYDDTHVRNIAVGVKDGSLQAVYNGIDGDEGQAELEAALVDGLERTFRWDYTETTPTESRTFTAIVESIADAPGLKGLVVKTAALKVNSVMD